ncbi:MAG: C40 family peptidase [Cyanobacteria bacterium SZAS LIN-3]|nr:C40 family peptidase [Cyanobacteria bacterium SZAS LIN-3]
MKMKNYTLSAVLWVLAPVLAIGCGATLTPSVRAQDQNQRQAPYSTDGYVSPYRIKYTIPLEKLLEPDSVPPRNSRHEESQTPHRLWYSPEVRKRFGSWGPEARRFSPPDIEAALASDPAWMRQRLLAVGERYIGLPYQHHHIPDWDPPANWPWKEVAYGRQSRGIDCSDFTSWLYNYGLGIKLTTDVHKQAQVKRAPAPGGNGTIPLQTIRGDDYPTLIKKLTSGDLLYIRNKKGEVNHVIMWVGQYGFSPDGTPLVLDSTGSGHKDSNGIDIPVGVHLRPFTPDSWYYKSFSHAHRIIPL